jgi:hypothetical protein
MEAFRHVLRTPALGRFLVPWDGIPLVLGIVAGFILDLNLVFLLFCLSLTMTGLFWIRRSGEGTLRAWVLYHARKRLFLVE